MTGSLFVSVIYNPMCRPIRIVLKSAVIYVVFSLVAGFVLAEMTLRPGRTHANQARIAEMYAQYRCEAGFGFHPLLQTELSYAPGIACPHMKMDAPSFCCMALATIAEVLRDMDSEFLAHGYRVLVAGFAGAW